MEQNREIVELFVLNVNQFDAHNMIMFNISNCMLSVSVFRRIYLNGNLQSGDLVILNSREASIMDGSSCLQNIRFSHLHLCC